MAAAASTKWRRRVVETRAAYKVIGGVLTDATDRTIQSFRHTFEATA